MNLKGIGIIGERINNNDVDNAIKNYMSGNFNKPMEPINYINSKEENKHLVGFTGSFTCRESLIYDMRRMERIYDGIRTIYPNIKYRGFVNYTLATRQEKEEKNVYDFIRDNLISVESFIPYKQGFIEVYKNPTLISLYIYMLRGEIFIYDTKKLIKHFVDRTQAQLKSISRPSQFAPDTLQIAFAIHCLSFVNKKISVSRVIPFIHSDDINGIASFGGILMRELPEHFIDFGKEYFKDLYGKIVWKSTDARLVTYGKYEEVFKQEEVKHEII